MKRARAFRIAITSCVINSRHEGDLPARAQIVEECWPNIDIQIRKLVCCGIVVQRWITVQLLHVSSNFAENIALIKVSASKLNRRNFIISTQLT